MCNAIPQTQSFFRTLMMLRVGRASAKVIEKKSYRHLSRASQSFLLRNILHSKLASLLILFCLFKVVRISTIHIIAKFWLRGSHLKLS